MRAQNDPRLQTGADPAGPGGAAGPTGPVDPSGAGHGLRPSASPPPTTPLGGTGVGATAPAEPVVPRTRAGSAWVGVAVGMVVLVVFVVFIVQNIHGEKVSFLFFHWKLPLAIDLLLAAILGGLVVFLLGSVRMLQLRRAAKRNARSPIPR